MKFFILLPMVLIGFFVFTKVIDLPFGYFLILFIVPILNFGIIPMSRILGLSTYLSPMVLTFGKDVKDYQIHNVMSFDYLINFKWSERGKTAQKKILAYYFEALLHIIHKIETNELPKSVKVVGNSYFFNARTAEKLGFTISKANVYRILNSIFGCIELILLYSFSQGKLSVPKFWKLRKVSISGEKLVLKKDLIQQYFDSLSN